MSATCYVSAKDYALKERLAQSAETTKAEGASQPLRADKRNADS